MAASAELFDGKLKHGVWAHPNDNGVLRIRFPNVEIGSRIEGFAGFPDWQLVLRDRAIKKGTPSPAAAQVRVVVVDPLPWSRTPLLRRLRAFAGDGILKDDQRPVGVVVEAVTAVPVERGTTALAVDTGLLSGQRKDVVVEISGGSGDVEGRFLFDLAVVP